jgi:hypothetical protein
MLVDFNKRWQSESRKPGAHFGSVTIGAKPFFSIASDPLTANDVEALTNQTKTIYVMFRVSWRDQTGRWATDYCGAYQDKVFTSPVLHACYFIDADIVRYSELYLGVRRRDR